MCVVSEMVTVINIGKILVISPNMFHIGPQRVLVSLLVYAIRLSLSPVALANLLLNLRFSIWQMWPIFSQY